MIKQILIFKVLSRSMNDFPVFKNDMMTQVPEIKNMQLAIGKKDKTISFEVDSLCIDLIYLFLREYDVKACFVKRLFLVNASRETHNTVS